LALFSLLVASPAFALAITAKDMLAFLLTITLLLGTVVFLLGTAVFLLCAAALAVHLVHVRLKFLKVEVLEIKVINKVIIIKEVVIINQGTFVLRSRKGGQMRGAGNRARARGDGVGRRGRGRGRSDGPGCGHLNGQHPIGTASSMSMSMRALGSRRNALGSDNGSQTHWGWTSTCRRWRSGPTLECGVV
jgi:hypothetical protein